MTWTVIKDMAVSSTDEKLGNIGQLLCQSLVQAQMSNRMTCGVFECAKLLACNPDNVMLCVLPETTGLHDVTLDIQHTLIEAFCWENEIRLIKVDSQEKLAKMIAGLQAEDDNNNDNVAMSRSPNTDVSCLLVEYPKGSISSGDDLLADYITAVINNDTDTKTVIELPV